MRVHDEGLHAPWRFPVYASPRSVWVPGQEDLPAGNNPWLRALATWEWLAPWIWTGYHGSPPWPALVQTQAGDYVWYWRLQAPALYGLHINTRRWWWICRAVRGGSGRTWDLMDRDAKMMTGEARACLHKCFRYATAAAWPVWWQPWYDGIDGETVSRVGWLRSFPGGHWEFTRDADS